MCVHTQHSTCTQHVCTYIKLYMHTFYMTWPTYYTNSYIHVHIHWHTEGKYIRRYCTHTYIHDIHTYIHTWHMILYIFINYICIPSTWHDLHTIQIHTYMYTYIDIPKVNIYEGTVHIHTYITFIHTYMTYDTIYIFINFNKLIFIYLNYKLYIIL